MSGDPEFDDFLRRRRPLFRDVDDGLEPPPEVDRIVLRQARDAIESDRPVRLLGMPRWAAPLAIAATLVIGLAVVFRAGTHPVQLTPEVRVESVAQRMDAPETGTPAVDVPAVAAAAPPPVDAPVVVMLAPPPAPLPSARALPASNADTAAVATWRRDARSWQAEIDRLRASGDRARAEREQEEFNRQFRAMATTPDR